jgi:hypothetical protein
VRRRRCRLRLAGQGVGGGKSVASEVGGGAVTELSGLEGTVGELPGAVGRLVVAPFPSTGAVGVEGCVGDSSGARVGDKLGAGLVAVLGRGACGLVSTVS